MSARRRGGWLIAALLAVSVSCSDGLTTLDLARVDEKPLVLLPNSGRQGQLILVEAVIASLPSDAQNWYLSELPSGSGLRVVRYYSRGCDEIDTESVAALGQTTDVTTEASDADGGSSDGESTGTVDSSAEHDTTVGTLEYHACFEVEIDSTAPLGVQLLKLKISNDTGERISGESSFYVVEPLD
ncbi:MAG: hypothetical protein KC609_14290 [Myxococcales bacterium]|nr:hypothetical protein [Myxococcales bacterium]